MTDNYIIDFTDQNPNNSFVLASYTTNGPENPTSTNLDAAAVSAATSLLLYGKGSPNYGERIQENLVHMLENFSGDQEPTYPISGQLWYNTNVDGSGNGSLQVYISDALPILAVDQPNGIFTIAGNHTTRFVAGYIFRVAGSTGNDGTYVVASSVPNGGDTDIIVNAASIPLPSAVPDGSIGGWITVVQTNGTASMIGDLDMGGYNVVNLADPTNPQNGMTLNYADLNYVSLAGDTMTGDLEFDIPALSANSAGIRWSDTGDDVARMYVDSDGAGTSVLTISIANESADYLSFVHGTTEMVAFTDSNATFNVRPQVDSLLLTPTAPNHLTTKDYVDTVVGGASGSLAGLSDTTIIAPAVGHILEHDGVDWKNVPGPSATYLPLAGGTMTGALTLSGAPTIALHAATKGYVDTWTDNGNVYNTAIFDGTTLTLGRVGGGSTPLGPFNTGGGGSTTATVTHTNAPTYQNNIFGDLLEDTFGQDVGYPVITLASAIQAISERIAAARAPNVREIVAGTGASAYTFTNITYNVGYNNMWVYVDGIKQVANTRGSVEFGMNAPPNPPYGIYPTVDTGLSAATDYDFRITVDGGSPTVITVNLPTTTLWQDLVDEINTELGLAGVGAYAAFTGKFMTIFSDTDGTGSSVVVDATGITNTYLVSSLTGTVGLLTAAGATYDYSETGDSGSGDSFYGTEGDTITFTSSVSGTATIEAIVTNSYLYRD